MAIKNTAVDVTIAVTAVDTFVYDTRKDSDGGAWRKRTQHTSWYNETLNTATRGSRKEFPTVAVIVAESGTLTIYDGDDPSMPMWMVFNTSSNLMIRTSDISSISILNGEMYVCLHSNGDLQYISFIKDGARWITASTAYGGWYKQGGISNRNEGSSYGYYNDVAGISDITIVNSMTNDIAMTVLPNAPIDPDTGLPVPTIAVATNGGVSVIKDNGTVVDSSELIKYSSVDISKDYRLISGRSGNTRFFISEPLSTFNSDAWVPYGFAYLTEAGAYPSLIGNDISDNFSRGKDCYARGGAKSLTLWNVKESDVNVAQDNETESSVAYITSDYNTGWMNGDIKLATLSDTDTTDAVGTELVTNGTFDSDTGWTLSTGWAISGGKIRKSDNSNNSAMQTITTVVGKTYTISVTVDTGASNSFLYAVGSFTGDNMASAGQYSRTFTAVSTSTLVGITCVPGNGLIADNFSVRLAEEDRSVNGNGLQVFGTITKTPVATGADLVAYSGFSGSNYLEQPYNSDLDFGTGDFSAMGWFKSNTTVGGNQPLFMRGVTDTNNLAMIEPYIRADGKVDVLTRDAAEGLSYYTSTGSILTQNWLHWCMARSSGVMSFYVNGIHEGSAANTRNVTPTTDAKKLLRVGSDVTLGKALPGSAALFRISATAPTAKQIAKIYNDEKHLFQENAQATLYGTSDAVTALAYDDDTELLHAGTSSGRSVFQGLRRVSNTTDAITTSISASNSIIVEE